MRFSELLAALESLQPEGDRWLADDPPLDGAAALDKAQQGQLGFLERSNAMMAAALAHCDASAVLLPADDESLHRLARQQGIAWAASADPRLSFAEALDCLYPRQRPTPGRHPQAVVAPDAHVADSASLAAGVVVGARCHVGEEAVLHPGVVLYDDVWIGQGCELHGNVVVHSHSHLGRNCVVQANAVIGGEGFGFVPTGRGWRKMPQTGHVVLEDGVEVGCCSTVDRPAVGETRLGAGTKIDNLVQIGHGVVTGKGCAFAAQVGIAGGAVLGRGVILGGQVGVINRVRLGDGVVASSKAGVHTDVAPGEVVSGFPIIPNRLWLRASALFARLPELSRSLKRLQQQVERSRQP
ncbi:MAG: UDP-3-O-(3-hydroxymyristoyl) glucosamine N-acyltransferase [Candidatus Synechococcus spongiarum SP3]|uniref:UDP-3-O-acylglucosamine N-acyltransferase n=1 Tax=Candidatus Synechococcus spongiarum SP3 TaxID=1604020 RepID=A0A0G2IWT3_9SYNE|nr:MAG: UDP-3-O-(3-hydroxymyristoyl) glucosamine N-acyltransferase [Candidatus Synechococcus spongiarum SP3]